MYISGRYETGRPDVLTGGFDLFCCKGARMGRAGPGPCSHSYEFSRSLEGLSVALRARCPVLYCNPVPMFHRNHDTSGSSAKTSPNVTMYHCPVSGQVGLPDPSLQYCRG